ncbi:MAG: histone deacetylase, partial [Actinomycetota bacterium]|nr:histone deacetylase [Actinomycetota bacterium]
MHVYSDPASERHINNMAHVEAPERFPAALAGVEEAKKAGVPVEHRPCQPAPTDALEAVHAPRYLDSIKELSARGGGYLDFDTALSSDSWEAATLAAGAA